MLGGWITNMLRPTEKLIDIILVGVVLAILLFSMMPITYAQVKIPREDAVYIPSAGWWPSGFNLLGSNSAGSNFLYLPLFMYNYLKDAWLPLLAERIEFIDPLTIRVYIRSEAMWSDGKPIVADDIEYTYFVAQQVNMGPGVGCQEFLEYMKAVSDKVLEVKIKDPPRNYFQALRCVMTFIPLPKHVIEPLYSEQGNKITEWKNDDPTKQVVSGPYKLYYFDDTIMVWIRLDDWWGKNIFGLPKPKYVVQVFYKDNSVANLALENGDVDWAGVFTPEIWELFDKGVGTWFKEKPYYLSTGMSFIYLNLKDRVLQNVAVRKAIAYAISYEEILNRTRFGYSVQPTAVAVNHLFEPYKQYIFTDVCEKYLGTSECFFKTDPEKAKKILDEAGIIDRNGDGIRELPDGTPLKVTCSMPYGWTDAMMMCEMIVEDLRNIGFDAETFFPDFSVWWNSIIEGTFSMVLGWDSGIGFDHPWSVYRWVMDPRITPPAGNWERYNNSEVIVLLDQAAANAFNPDIYRDYIKRLQEIFLRDLPAIPWTYDVHWYAYNTKYWVGWPNNESPWWFPVAPWDASLPVLFGIAKKGEIPVPPKWLETIDNGGFLIPTSKIWQQMLEMNRSITTSPQTTTSPTTPTQVVTVTVTVPTTVVSTVGAATVTATVTSVATVTTTSVSVSPTTTTVEVTNWTITAALAIALLIIGFAIGWLIKRK
ncbi:MAG: ABC transporter substrate-binding protein [Ignisphaera sp.]